MARSSSDAAKPWASSRDRMIGAVPLPMEMNQFQSSLGWHWKRSRRRYFTSAEKGSHLVARSNTAQAPRTPSRTPRCTHDDRAWRRSWSAAGSSVPSSAGSTAKPCSSVPGMNGRDREAE